ncbi:hypothetical protein M413DRAFT_446565 [Hebeloma cylindrosporum]|uniref:Cytochrome P450 n=1 Tax=Hebeloma cylindrosporum TaxID=76867 RepID=A0A0C2XRQ2_HEBCY|nr:hypothetical protein M413DRAFT_446565 [Hebeloma cylindrosporum h7]
MTLASPFVALALLAILYPLYRKFTRTLISDLPGPEPETFILGNLRQYFRSQAGEIEFEWQEAYGDVVRFKGPFGEDRLLVSDPKALQYIYHTAGYRFGKQAEKRQISIMLSGKGILWADGEDHKRHRRIMTPAFGSKESKAFVPLFFAYAAKLGSKWKDILATSPKQESVFNVSDWFSRATLDAMAVAAFDYQIDLLENADNELGKAYSKLLVGAFGSPTEGDLLQQFFMPYLPKFLLSYVRSSVPSQRLQYFRNAKKVAVRVAKGLIDSKTEALNLGKGSRDVMSLLVHANASEEAKTRMNEEEMISQMRTILLAGFETTATALSWCILEVARHTSVQDRLRREIRAKEREIKARGDTEFTSNDFDAMPYLQAVLKEALRFHPPAFNTYREAIVNDVIPLSKPITTLSGKVITEIPVPKGMKVVTSINGYNRHKSIFGEDSHVFDPERWLNPGRIEKMVNVGVFGNLMSFAGGIRSCIAWRFAVLELHAFIVELINTFEFALTPEAQMVRRESCFVMSPMLESQVDKGAQLPLRVKLASREED